MRIIYLMQEDSDTWVTIVIFIIVGISFLVNVIKKAIQGSQGNQNEQGQTPKPRSRFLDLIEEVRRMAEEGGESKPKMPGQQPPFIKIEKIIQKQTMVSPTVPKLKPVGGEKAATSSPQPQVIKPYTPQQTVAARYTSQEEYLEDEEELISAVEAKRQFEARENALKMREEALRIAEERLSRVETNIEEQQSSYEVARKEAVKPPPVSKEGKDYSGIFKSPESLKDAIVLREILGPPKALQRRKRYAQIQ